MLRQNHYYIIFIWQTIMDIQSDWITTTGLWLSWVLFVLFSGLALFQANWSRLRESDSSNIYFAIIAILFVIWNMRATLGDGESLHLLGVSLACLMFGWEFAFIAIQLILLLTVITTPGFDILGGWPAFATNALLHGLIPAGFTYGILRLSQKFLPLNYFVYFFLNTFFATIAGILLITAVVWLLFIAGIFNSGYSIREFTPVMLILSFPEGMLTGMLITVFVVYKPEWVTTFRDEVYLQRR